MLKENSTTSVQIKESSKVKNLNSETRLLIDNSFIQKDEIHFIQHPLLKQLQCD